MTRLHLNLGCGLHLIPGFVNVDRIAAPGVDQVHDLDTPWPWDDGAADRIEAKDVFEHVADPILFMTEAWRVLCTGGTMFIRTPHWQHQDAYTDPTHRRFCTEFTFDYWIAGTLLHRLHNRFYGAVSFHRDSLMMDGGSLMIFLSKIGEKSNAAHRSTIDQRQHVLPPHQRGPRADRTLAARDVRPDQAAGMVPGADHLPAGLAP